jgi:hypothetical protein
MTRYEDVLQECLDELAAGEALEAVLARHGSESQRLREELATAVALRADAARLPAPRTEAAWTALAGELRAARAARQRLHARIWFSPRLLLGGVAMAAVLAAVAVGLFGGVFSLGGAGTAEAVTLEGVVVEKADGMLTLQTKSGLETVQLAADATLTDASGAPIEAAALEVGTLVTAAGQRKAGAVTIKRIDLPAAAKIRVWCAEFPVRCEEAASQLQDKADRCQAALPACEEVKQRLQQIQESLAATDRLQGLVERCQQGAAALCRQLLDLCQANTEGCARIIAWLRGLDPLPPAVRGRIEELRSECKQGVAAACRVLEQLCAQLQLCANEAPVRPSDTTSRPADSPVTDAARPATATPQARPTATSR